MPKCQVIDPAFSWGDDRNPRTPWHDTIIYEATMEDPEVFTKPWKQYATLRLRPGERIREYECIENNEDIQRFEKLLETEFKK